MTRKGEKPKLKAKGSKSKTALSKPGKPKSAKETIERLNEVAVVTIEGPLGVPVYVRVVK